MRRGATRNSSGYCLCTRTIPFDILDDLIAGKEQALGTPSARSLGWTGGPPHYGHPDFLHALHIISTRDGVSRARSTFE